MLTERGVAVGGSLCSQSNHHLALCSKTVEIARMTSTADDGASAVPGGWPRIHRIGKQLVKFTTQLLRGPPVFASPLAAGFAVTGERAGERIALCVKV